MIKAILFDVDGVLVDSREANRLFKRELFKRAGYYDLEEEHIEGFHKPIKQVIDEVLASRNIANEAEADRLFKMMFDPHIRDLQIKNYKFPKNLITVLRDLSKQYTLGIVTSRIRYGMDEVFSLRPIEKYFETVITFDDVLNHKPHPEPLIKALDDLNLRPNEAIYIGDSDTDIIAAAAIDMPSIHISEAMHELAHHQIKDFSEVEDAIKLVIENHADNNSK